LHVTANVGPTFGAAAGGLSQQALAALRAVDAAENRHQKKRSSKGRSAQTLSREATASQGERLGRAPIGNRWSNDRPQCRRGRGKRTSGTGVSRRSRRGSWPRRRHRRAAELIDEAPLERRLPVQTRPRQPRGDSCHVEPPAFGDLGEEVVVEGACLGFQPVALAGPRADSRNESQRSPRLTMSLLTPSRSVQTVQGRFAGEDADRSGDRRRLGNDGGSSGGDV
jgi:hypothetical protein